MGFQKKKGANWMNGDPQAHGSNHNATITYWEYVHGSCHPAPPQQQQRSLLTFSHGQSEYPELTLPVNSPAAMSMWQSPSHQY